MLALVGTVQADDFGTGGDQFTIDFVPISGDAGDLGSWPAGTGYAFSGVNRDNYRMGTFEITNDQWTKFIAAYGIVTGAPWYAYDEFPDWTGTNVPTNEVSWHEAAQFVNWLNTSTGHQAAYKFTGTQGTGDYTFATWSPAEADNGTNLYRHRDAFYYMPTEDEWVKAGYWNGTSLQAYANASPDDLLVSGLPDPTKWNYSPSEVNEPWDVGSGVMELNGTFDMMGNVWEWMESPNGDPTYGADYPRGMRGGPYFDSGNYLASSNRISYDPLNEGSSLGFRVASNVPEEPVCETLGDVDGSTTVDGNDVAGFVRIKLGNPAPGDNELCADYGTGTLEDDVAAFIVDLLSP